MRRVASGWRQAVRFDAGACGTWCGQTAAGRRHRRPAAPLFKSFGDEISSGKPCGSRAVPRNASSPFSPFGAFRLPRSWAPPLCESV